MTLNSSAPPGRIWQGLALALYAAVLRLLTPLYLLRLGWRSLKEPLYRHAIGQRLGLYGGPKPAPGLLWLHAVSLGETRASQPLVDQLRRLRPGLRFLFTHGTGTGLAAGELLVQPGDCQAWMPFDTPGATRRFLRHFQPAMGVLMETEIWPSMQHQAGLAGIPMAQANARLNPRSAQRGRRFAALLHPAAARLALALAQTEDDAQRLRAAGVPQVQVCGNLKFDVTPPPELLALGRRWRQAIEAKRRPVLLAASTREGEEAMLLKLWREQPLPRPLLLLVPRHPQRFDEVAALVQAGGLSLLRRSSWADLPPPDAGQGDVWLGDTIGEMPAFYACADVALLGGSYANFGGQNLIEAAACGCPVVMGPHTFNFAQAATDALAAGAAIRAPNLAAGLRAAVALARDPQRDAWAQHALAFAAAHQGAAERVAVQLLRLLPPAPDSGSAPG